MTPVDNQQLHESYQESERQLLARHTAVACWLSLILVPAGITLDYFVYPEFFQTFLIARIVCDLLIVPVYVLLLTAIGKRFVRWTSALWAVIPMWMICWMIYRSEGSISSYYAGLNLMIIATCQLLPSKFLDASLYCGVVLISYTVACWGSFQTADFSRFYNNFYFVLLTSTICVTACLYFERRRFEEFRLRYELDRSNQQLAQIDQIKSKFFANISHELRTPLTLVLSPVERLLNQPERVPESTRETLEVVRQNGLRLLRLINDLLDIVRLEEGKAFVNLRRIDVVGLLSGLIESVRLLAEQKNLSLVAPPERVPIHVDADPARLEKVFLNLLSNAVKFTPAGGTISIKWETRDRSVEIAIADSGIGIPEHYLSHIFQRFGQVDASITREYQGLGIGLALAKDLIKENRGELKVTSREGCGSCFTVVLPVSDSTESPLTAAVTEQGDPMLEMFQQASRSLLGTESRASRSLTNAQPSGMDRSRDGQLRKRLDVLVVDDDPDMRAFLLQIVNDHFHAIGASRGREGIDIAKQELPKVMVLDQMMPEMSGLEVAAILRREVATRATKILMLTARVDEKSKLDALAAGVDDFLTKPFSSLEVQSRINNLIRTFDLEFDLRQSNHDLNETIHKLRTTEFQLIQSEKINAIGSLSAGLLHEINNPLNFTMMAVESLAAGADPQDAEIQETLADIASGMKRIGTIVSDLRAFAYPEQVDLKTRFKVQAAIDSAIRFTAHETRDVKLESESDPELFVMGSQTHITHVLVNLIINARHAVEKVRNQRRPTIQLRSQRRGARIEMAVADNGCGIPPENQNRIFEPFFTTREVGQGMGLGLSICHTIIKNHGGEIRFDSSPSGTTFLFDIPSADGEQSS